MTNVIPQNYGVNLDKRSSLKKHKPLVIWFTGLSGSGKSTIANLVEEELFKENIYTYTLDGDNIRGGLNSDLSFSEEDRTENLRRIAEVARLFFDSGTVVLSAFITPLEADRNLVKKIIGKENFVQVFINTSIEECERRDVKGLYQKARAGKIANFTGINAPYEPPPNPDIIINTEEEEISEAVKKIINYIKPKLRLHKDE